MFKHDTPLIARDDISAATGLLMRLPITVDGAKATARGAASAWAFPLVGAIVGVIMAAATALLIAMDVPAGIVAGLVLALAVIITGAMHEDGLADCADGFWGGWDRARRLAIMKDSHIGVYGVCALGLTLLLRWFAMVGIIAYGLHWVAFIAIGALSRTGMLVLMGTMINARDHGLSQSVGRPDQGTVWIGVAIAAAVAIMCGYLVLIPMAVLATLACGLIARAKIGGQTGDVLGATQQITEVTLLITVASIFG